MQRLLSALVDTDSCIIVVLPPRIRVKQYLFSLNWTILTVISGGTASVLLGIESASVCFLELSFWAFLMPADIRETGTEKQNENDMQ